MCSVQWTRSQYLLFLLKRRTQARRSVFLCVFLCVSAFAEWTPRAVSWGSGGWGMELVSSSEVVNLPVT